MNTLYGRIHPRQEAKRFFRCGFEFGRDWRSVGEVDAATAQRLAEEQMLEVTGTLPAESDAAPAGDSADARRPPADGTAPPAAAPADGGAEQTEAPSGDAPGAGKPDDLEVLAEQIKVAIRALDKGDASLWTVGGAPKTEAIAARTGWPVTAAERNAAMEGL